MSIISPEPKVLPRCAGALPAPLVTLFASLFAALSLLICASAANGATYAYTSTTFAYDTPSGAATALTWHTTTNTAPGCTSYPNADDDFADIVFPGAFSFTFGGTAYTGVRVYSNGILVFGTDTSGFHRTFTNAALPAGAAGALNGSCPGGQPVNMMHVYWDDIVADPAAGAAGASIKYELLGTAPNRRLVISWTNVILYSTSTTYNFQVALFESAAGSNGNFRYQYTNGSSNGSSATVGVQLTTTDYTQFAFNQSFIDTTVGTAILWYPANQLAAKGAEYRFDESAWTGAAGEIKDTSGGGFNASRTTSSVANVAAGKLCRGGTFTNNTLNTTIDAVATPITPANQGSVDFWYKSNGAWNTTNNMLFDATTVAGKPFFLMKMSTGALKFVITDSAGATYTAQTSTAFTTAAGTWVHIGVSWNVKAGTNQTVQQIMINGSLQTTNTTTPFRSTTSGAIGSFSTIYIGDNRTSGVTPTGGTPNGADGTIDEVYIYATEINATQEGADASLTRPTCTTLDHFHISHPGTVVNCGGAGASVTVEAHDSTHALFTLAGTTMQMATSTGNGTWSSVSTINPVINSGGGAGSYTFANESSIVLGLQDSVVETLNINLTSGAITEHTGTAASCVASDYTIGAVCDANLSFLQSGFIFATAANGTTPIPSPLVAGTTTGTYYLRAVQAASPATSACTAALVGANTVNLAYECNDPIACSSSNLMTITGSAATTIQRNNNGAALSYTSVPLVFDASGNAPFTINFADVGKTTLYASKTIAPTTLTGSSGVIYTKPFGFTLSNIKTTAGAVANPAAANAAGAKFIQAGAAFTATVTANTSGGAAAPNFGQEVSPATVTLTPALVGGLGLTNNPGLNNPSAFGTFAAGVATGTTFSWDEVGIITLTPAVTNYLNLNSIVGGTAGNVAGTTTGNVGRFVPGQFSISAGAAVNACTTGATPFTYFGQDGFTTAFTITAKNVAGTATTQNYAGSFAKLGLTTWANYGFATSLALPAGSNLLPSATAPVGVWGTVNAVATAGAASVVAKHQVSRPNLLTVPTDVTVTALPADGDGVTLSPATAVAVSGAVKQYFGRLRVPNVVGSQNRNATLSMTTEYYDTAAPGGFRTNTNDNCTVVPASVFSFGNFRKTMTAADAVPLCFPAKFTGGIGYPQTATGSCANRLLALQKPVAGHTGTYDMAISLGTVTDTSCLQVWAPGIAATATANLAYLQGNWCGATYAKDPSVRASFGTYSGAKNIVYQRENF